VGTDLVDMKGSVGQVEGIMGRNQPGGLEGSVGQVGGIVGKN
jgi:hypothetical protein